MQNYRVNDLGWSLFGDLSLSTTGDLRDTSDYSLQSFLQEVRTRLQSELYDWKLQPHIGASLSDIIGEPNNKETAEQGKTKIIASLTKDGLVAASILRVRYTPVDRHHILFNVIIALPDLSADEEVSISMLMNINEREITFLN